MNRLFTVAVLLLVSVAARPVWAQDAPAAVPRFTPVRVQVVLTRYEGEKKTSSMPNSLWVNVSDDPKMRNAGRLRIGAQVPVHVVANNTTTVAYKDVGNLIDCEVNPHGDGRYRLQLRVEQSSVDNSVRNAAESGRSANPILRSFASEFMMVLRDGQTVQSTVATDPISGEVLKVDVTLSVVK